MKYRESATYLLYSSNILDVVIALNVRPVRIHMLYEEEAGALLDRLQNSFMTMQSIHLEIRI
jgi:hypothetical protein